MKLKRFTNKVLDVGEAILSIAFIPIVFMVVVVAILSLGLLAIFYQEILGDLLSSLKFW